MDLNGKTVVVTGACGILGSVFTERLAAAGAQVIALDLEAQVRSRSAGAPSSGSVHYQAVDLSDPDEIGSVAADLIERFGAPHALVNNAASKGSDVQAFMKDALEMSPQTWREVSSVNLEGAFFTTQAFGRAMIREGRGSIVFIGSIYGEVGPNPRIYEGSLYLGGQINTPPVYSATKAGVSGLTRYLATYWGRHGVRVNCICPGGVESGQNSAFTENYRRNVPLGRMARADDIADPVLFFVSDGSRYITGQTLLVDGGMSVW